MEDSIYINATDNLKRIKKLPVWNKSTLPANRVKVDAFARLVVLNGKFRFYALDEQEHIVEEHIYDKDNQQPILKPNVLHRVEPVTDDLECYLELFEKIEYE